MKADDLDLFDALDRCNKLGTIRFKNRRMLLWDADAFGHLRKELVDSLGLASASNILRRFGFANGYRDAITTGELFQWDNDREWWLSCPALQNQEGKVAATPTSLKIDRSQGVFSMQVDWRDSYEAGQHLRLFGPAEAPVCWSVSGYASGFATALMGQEVYVVEQQCRAKGDEICAVVGKTRTAWGERGDEWANQYQARDLAAELAERDRELERQRRTLRRRERQLAEMREQHAQHDREGLISESREMETVLALASNIARVDSTLLLTGESGVGKERIAAFVHRASQRSTLPFVAINCGALPDPLLESELFGHIRGAFTGAVSDRKGVFEAARGGTLFLDEVGELSPATQVKLLRVIQEREVRPVGSSTAHPIDIRLIAATNRDLPKMVADGSFRQDLFYRLQVLTIDIPPLRSRQADIIPLARKFIRELDTASSPGQRRRLAPDAIETLTAYAWPGNVRELRNAIEYAILMAESQIETRHLPPSLREQSGFRAPASDSILPMEAIERNYVLHVLDRCQGNRSSAAKALGIGTNTLWRKLKRWGIPPARAS